VKTPLETQTRSICEETGILVIIACVAIFLVEGLRGQPFITSFMMAIALAVSAVPEGLPAILTVTLALGARDLAKNKAIIRRLASVETLGSTTVICTDKTGTLTKGEMMVREAYTLQTTYMFSGDGYEPNGQITVSDKTVSPTSDAHLLLLMQVGALCNNAKLVNDQSWHILGDPTEGALLPAAAKVGLNLDEVIPQYPRINEIAFSSERKRMSTIHTTPTGEHVLYYARAYVYPRARGSHIRPTGLPVD
jgi:Ca2+-transporting ATPase